MSNTNLTIDMITKEALRVAHEKAVFVGTINRSFDDSFGVEGAKSGSTLRIRKPNQFSRRQGTAVMNVQDVETTAITMTVATQDGVDMRFGAAELALDIDEFSKLYIQPAMQALVSGIDSDILQGCTQLVYNQVGTAGTVIGASGDITPLFNARAKLNQNLAPMDKRIVQMDSISMASVVNNTKLIINPAADSGKAFREGYYGRIGGADYYENERTYSHTAGAGIASLSTAANATITDGGGSGETCTITWSGSEAMAKGDVFTLPKVYQCHPETKANLGVLQQFVVTAASTGSTATIMPRVYWSGAKQNVCNATGGACVTGDFDSETVTAVGTASTASKQSLMYHPDAFAFVSADLPLMADAAKCVRMNADGLSLRVWQGSDIINDQLLTRIDILYGYAVIRPAWACRIITS